MKLRRQAAGFTIIELMIASLVFSIFLLLLTSMIIGITHTYYKGIIASKTQEATRSIMTDISQSIQFGGAGAVNTDNASYLCVGSARFRYTTGLQVVDANPGADRSYHALVEDGAACLPTPVVNSIPKDLTATDMQELVPTGMRLSKLQVTPVPATTNLYQVTVRVVYGDADLVCSPSLAGDCAANGVSGGLTHTDLACKPAAAGTQFCAVSELTTTVEKRI